MLGKPGLLAAIPLALSLTFALGHAQEASPNFFSYFPDDNGGGARFELGRGFIQNDLSKVFVIDCLDYKKQPGLSGGGGDNIRLTTEVVTSYNSMLDAFGIDASVSVHYLTASLDAKFAESRALTSSTSNVTIVVQASADYSFMSIRNVKVRAPYSDWLSAGRLEDFRNTCGARVPIREILGVRLSAAITILDASSDLHQKTSASVVAGAGRGAISASASVAFNQELQTAQKDHRVQVTVSARGGEPANLFEGQVKEAIKAQVSVDAIGEALATFAKTMSRDQAATIGFDVADMPLLNIAQQDPWSEEKQRHLSQLLQYYQHLADKRNILQSLVDKTDPRYQKYSVTQLSAFSAPIESLNNAVQIVAITHAACKMAKTPDLDPCKLDQTQISSALQIPAPGPVAPPRGQFAVGIRSGGDWKNSNLTPWRLLSTLDESSIYLSPVANNVPSNPDFNVMAQYDKRNIARIASVIPDVKRYMSAYLITTEDLDSLETYFVRLEKASRDGDPPTETHRQTFKAWGSGELGEMDPAKRFSKESIEDRPHFYAYIINATYSHQPPKCNCQPGTDKFSAYMNEYRDFFTLDRSYLYNKQLELELLPAIGVAVGQGTNTGAGELRLSARDKFGGSQDMVLISVNWDYDEQLDMVRLEYKYNTGEPSDVVYLTNVKTPLAFINDPANAFPQLRREVTWEMDMYVGGAPIGMTLPALKDKWNSVTTKVCRVSINNVGPTRGDRLTTDLAPEKAVVSAVLIATTGAFGHFKFITKTDYLVQTDFTDNRFMAGFAGCQGE